MAILPSLPGIKINVRIDGRAVTEYDSNDELGTDQDLESENAVYQAGVTILKYIESVSEKTFAVNLSVKSPYGFGIDGQILRFTVLVDGKRVRAPLLLRNLYE